MQEIKELKAHLAHVCNRTQEHITTDHMGAYEGVNAAICLQC